MRAQENLGEMYFSAGRLGEARRQFETALAAPGLECTYDVVLVSAFASRAALDAYQEHPAHQAVKPFIGAVREARQCMDYEI